MLEKPAKPCVYTLAKSLVDSEPSNNSDGYIYHSLEHCT